MFTNNLKSQALALGMSDFSANNPRKSVTAVLNAVGAPETTPVREREIYASYALGFNG